MLVSVIPIGNSRGIRLPKAILDQLKIQDKLELEVEDNQLILKPIQKKAREGWELDFKDMNARHEDELFIPESIENGNFEWEW
jgi:antitoxin MazE